MTVDRSNVKALVVSAIVIILGIILSGPPMVLLIEYLKPQPEWVDVDTFVSHFYKLQTLPYWFGFLLIIGNVLFVVSASRLPTIRVKIHAPLSIICVVIYGALVSINYAIQTTAVPAMVSNQNVILETLSMTNPASLCWTLEMFGYAILGIAYWLAAVAFEGNGLLRTIRYLMVFNGVISVLGILIPVIDPRLLLEAGGLIGYWFWNLLIVLIMILIIVASKRMRSIESQLI